LRSAGHIYPSSMAPLEKEGDTQRNNESTTVSQLLVSKHS